MGEKENGIKFGKLMFQLVIIAISWELVYIIPFIQYTLYDPILKALECTNTQLGFLLTIYGLGNIFGAPIGGWLADRFDYRKIILGSVFLNGVVSFLFAFNMNYPFAVATWVGCAITSLVMNYPSMVKILRVIGKDNQGKVYGFNEAMVGVSGVVMGAIFLYIYTCFATPTLGMRWVMISLGILSIAMCPVLWYVIKDVDIREDKEEASEKMSAGDFMTVLKSPNTWLVGISIFCVYSFTVTMSYFTPYITSVLGGSVALSGALAINKTAWSKVVWSTIWRILCRQIKITYESTFTNLCIWYSSNNFIPSITCINSNDYIHSSNICSRYIRLHGKRYILCSSR